MTIRAIALVVGTLICIWALAMPDAVVAQGTRDSCAKVCDCTFECLDFCSADACSRPSACKKRVENMQKACQRVCDRCQSFKAKKK